MILESEGKPPVVEAKPPVVEAKPPVVEAKPPVVEDSDGKPAEDFDGKSAAKSAEDSDGKPAAKLAENNADEEKKSTPESKKKQKQYLIATVVILLIVVIGGFLLEQRGILNQVQQLQASLSQAENKTFANTSKFGQSALAGFGHLTQAVLSKLGFQAAPDGKEASHTANQVGKPLAEDLAPNDGEASTTTYEVSKPLVKDLTMNDEYVCQIRAIQHIEIRSLEKGYLQNVLVDEGETVHKGQLLFQIKPSVYQADVQKSEAEVELSKIELQNNQALVEKDIISPTEAAMSAAKLNKVKAELELAKTHLGFTEIRAPFDGLIGRFGDIRLGSLLEENQLLTTLSDTHRLWVYFNVPEGQYLDYMKTRRLNQNVQLELANKEIYPETGKIEVIQSDFNSTSGNIAFRASFSNPHGLLRYGETGQILWPKKISQAIIVPQKSTYEILAKRFIFVVDKTGLIHEREIKVAREAPNVYIVASGIAPDEMFLLERQNKLDKGDKIRYKLIDPKDAIEKLNLYAE
jgi:membrane fusion protein (multidrug efflux system)